MKINYLQDTDTLHIEICAGEMGEQRDFDENTSLGLDSQGRLCAITIKHASDRIDVSSLKYTLPHRRKGLNLNADEQGWLDEYRRQLQQKFPGLVEDILIYGPYARGISDPDIEMQVLVLISEGDRGRKEEVSYLGYIIDTEFFSTAPSISVYTRTEWEKRKQNDSPIYQRVTREGIRVI